MSDAATTADDGGQRSTVLVLTPDPSDPEASGVEEAHITLAYLNDGQQPLDETVLDDLRTVIEQIAGVTTPFQMSVSGAALLGPDKARVLLLESSDLRDLRDALLASSSVQAAMTAPQYPFYIPHMTLGYDGTELPQELPEAISAAALGLWVQGAKESYEFGSGEGGALGAGLDLMVPVASSADLDLGIRVANQHPGGRWYVTKRARALGLEHRLPTEWGAA
jgi:2'-5' RNA ligase